LRVTDKNEVCASGPGFNPQHQKEKKITGRKMCSSHLSTKKSMSRIYEELLNLNNIINQITQLFKWTQIQIDNLSKKSMEHGAGLKGCSTCPANSKRIIRDKNKDEMIAREKTVRFICP
jgi:hypothetical protein